MDPLQLLRQYQLNNQLGQVVLDTNTGKVEFGDRYAFDKDMSTTYRSQAGKGDFYTLETLLLYLQNISLAHPEYMRKVKTELKIPTVSLVDRKDLEEYLTGKKDYSDNISAVLPTFASAAPQKRPREAEGDAAEKRQREGEAGAAAGMGADKDGMDADGSREEAAALQEILQHERQLRNRNNQLSVPGASFAPLVRSMLKSVQQEVAERRRQQKAAAASASSAAGSSQHRSVVRPIPVASSGRHQRDVATHQLKTVGGGEFADLDINVYGRMQQQGAAAGPGGRKEPSAARPREAGSRHHAPGAPPPSAPPRPNHGQARAPAARPPSTSPTKPAAAGKRAGTPIILVPAGLTAKLTMANAKRFLQDGAYRTSEAARAEASGRKEPRLSFQRTALRDEAVEYIITDKPPPVNSSEWRNVVAVICQGVKWQFKDWPFKGASKGDLVETFSRVCGFFLKFHDEQVPDVVRSWNVEVLTLQRDARHNDVSVVQKLYSMLDRFLEHQGCDLKY